MTTSNTAEGRAASLDASALTVTLRRALVARNGLEVGVEAAADAMAWAVEHWDRLVTMENPTGYLYRVGQTAARRHRRRIRLDFPDEPRWEDAPVLEGDVFAALAKLRRNQRVAVVLVHAYEFTYRETAELLRISEAAAKNHVHRGLIKLRSILGEQS